MFCEEKLSPLLPKHAKLVTLPRVLAFNWWHISGLMATDSNACAPLPCAPAQHYRTTHHATPCRDKESYIFMDVWIELGAPEKEISSSSAPLYILVTRADTVHFSVTALSKAVSNHPYCQLPDSRYKSAMDFPALLQSYSSSLSAGVFPYSTLPPVPTLYLAGPPTAPGWTHRLWLHYITGTCCSALVGLGTCKGNLRAPLGIDAHICFTQKPMLG